jgi:F0F1-type ATP synthase membrane subunit b/b'
MNKSMLLMVMFTMVLWSTFTSCNSSAKKVENAEENVTEAKADLKDAKAEYMQEVENYRIQSAEKYDANVKSIEEFNLKIAKEKSQVKKSYDKQIAELEQKNMEMKKRMDEYRGESKDQWEQFKSEFNRDMDQLGTALSNLTVKNNK